MRSLHIRAGMLATAFCAAAFAQTTAEAPAYAIHYEQAFKTGQKFTVKVRDTLRYASKTQLPDGQVAPSDSLRRLVLDGELRVDDVDEKGRVTAASVTIGNFTQQKTAGASQIADALPSELLAPGTPVALHWKDGKVAFESKDDGSLGDEAAAALRQLFPPLPESSADNDAIYGVSDKRQVGDTWPVNVQALAATRDVPQGLDPDHTDGKVTFKAVRTIGGTACAQLEATLSSKNVPMEGTEAKESAVTATFSADLPLDKGKTVVSTHLDAKVHAVTEQKPNGMGTIRRTLDIETIHDVSWLPK